MLLRVTLPPRPDQPDSTPLLLGITWDHPRSYRATLTDLVDPVSGDPIVDMQERRATVCILYECDAQGKPEKEISKAIGNVYFRDRFEREAGRKLTLRRALVFTSFNREERGIIWQAYHERRTLKGETFNMPILEGSPGGVHVAAADIHAGEV